MDKYKTIGIVGGQGPVSTANIYMRIVQYFQKNFGARYVQDFPKIIIFSVPTPDLVESVQKNGRKLGVGNRVQRDSHTCGRRSILPVGVCAPASSRSTAHGAFLCYSGNKCYVTKEGGAKRIGRCNTNSSSMAKWVCVGLEF